ncbi:MAG: formyl transferase [Candidatus Limnocylindria bacterium]
MAAEIIDALGHRGLRPDLVIFEQPRGAAVMDRVRDMIRRRGILVTLRAIARRSAGAATGKQDPWLTAAFYEERAGQVVRVDALAAPEVVEKLRAARPELLVLAGAPILPSALLEVPRIGTLNAHPGLLPRYRGVDVVAHAVLNGDPVGATIHFVDAGIDTGRILSQVEVPAVAGDTLASLQARVETAGAVALAGAAHDLLEGHPPTTTTQSERFPLCRRLSGSQRQEAERRLRRHP